MPRTRLSGDLAAVLLGVTRIQVDRECLDGHPSRIMTDDITKKIETLDLESIAAAANKSILSAFPQDFLLNLAAHETKMKSMIEGVLGGVKPLQDSLKLLSADALGITSRLDYSIIKAPPIAAYYGSSLRELTDSIARAVNITSIGRLEVMSADIVNATKNVTMLSGSIGTALSGFAKSFESAGADYLSWQNELGAPRYLDCLKVWTQPLRDRVLGAELIVPTAASATLSARKISEDVVGEAEDYFFATLPDSLTLLDKGLVTMWRGSWDALRSRRPDYIRHSLISARELCNKVLHALAPDDQVKAWSKDPKHYDEKNRATRTARMLYIASGVSIPSLGTYLRKEIAASVELFDVLNKVHDISPPFDEIHMELILRKVHSTICTMIEMKTRGGLLPLK